ncbi:MAG: DASS family sodium-coupled anion symporter [Deltaproteobacteria bacterium]|nr:DASS family sodium-coupled anion symporter [Deltaproteobacteria bacterium]
MTDSRVIIDRRPITVVFISRTYRFFLLLLLGFAFYAFVSAPPWAGLSPEGYKAVGAFFLCLILWVTQLIPLAITGLLAVAIVPLLGIMPAKQAFSYFGNDAVFFILGAFILSAAILKTGLSTRLALLFLKGGVRSPRQLIWRILVSSAFLSCLMPEHAVAAFFLPIILEMARALEYEPFGGSYGRTLFLAMAWGCIIGGVVTFLGGGRAPLALGILKELTDQDIGFLDWMKTTVVLAVPMLGVAFVVLTFYFRIDVESVEGINRALEARRKKLGMTSWGEKWVLLILLLAVYFWMFHGLKAGLANIAIAAVVILFTFKVVSWKDVEEYVNWGIILMYGGAICLGRAMDSSGLIEWIAQKFLHYPEIIATHLGNWFGIGVPATYVLFVLLSLVALFLTEMMSNSAVVAVLLPVAIGLAHSYQLDPRLMAYVVALPAGLAFLLPISTPAVALAYSSGYLRIKDILIPGLMMNIIAWLLLVLVMKFWWPYLGMRY